MSVFYGYDYQYRLVLWHPRRIVRPVVYQAAENTDSQSGEGQVMSKYNVYVEDVSVEAVFNKLGGVEGARRLLRGDTEVTTKFHTIDCDANPFIPDGWKVEKHIKGGSLRWNPDNVNLYLFEGQQGSRSILGDKLCKKLKGKPFLNACVLDNLLANPNLIPEEWKGKAVFFWGTIYRESDGNLCVRYLCWLGNRWDWDYYWFGDVFDDNDLAAVFGKSA